MNEVPKRCEKHKKSDDYDIVVACEKGAENERQFRKYVSGIAKVDELFAGGGDMGGDMGSLIEEESLVAAPIVFAILRLRMQFMQVVDAEGNTSKSARPATGWNLGRETVSGFRTSSAASMESQSTSSTQFSGTQFDSESSDTLHHTVCLYV
jgi:hypothetical protein